MTAHARPSRFLRWSLAFLTALLPSISLAQFEHFVTARGDRLMDGDEELRFISYNIPNLHYVEDNHLFTEPSPWRPADEYEIRDALTSIRQMGGQITRMYVISVRKEKDDPRIIRHVTGPGRFNEEAFRSYDAVLDIANQVGVRVIIPFVDNWWWWGGPREYAAFRGKRKEEFWTDSLLIADFKQTIAFLVSRVNTRTGVPYRMDKAILGWETGNELEPPFAWTREIAAYIKSLDRNHLVIEGTHSKEIIDDALADPNLDVLSTHHYTPPDETIQKIVAARERTRGKKPYIVGEFGFMPTPDMRRVLDTVISTGVSGIMVWSLRGHNRDGGFYYHGRSFRWPGFPSGNSYDERNVVTLFRQKAYEITRRPVEPLPVPEPPVLLPIQTPYKISWKGSTGASHYVVERKEEAGAWRILDREVSDAVRGYRPLWADTTVSLGTRYSYRVRASNASGTSAPSGETGPVLATHHMIIDEMEDRSHIADASQGLRFLPPEDAGRAREDLGRVGGAPGDYLTYAVAGNIRCVQADFYFTSPARDRDVTFLTGDRPEGLTVAPIERSTLIVPVANEYGAYTAARYVLGAIPPEHRFVRIVLPLDTQLGCIEITYGGLATE